MAWPMSTSRTTPLGITYLVSADSALEKDRPSVSSAAIKLILFQFPDMINRLAVIGAGQMGGGIALTAASAGKMEVVLYDSHPESLARQVSLFGKLLDKDVAKGRIDPPAKREIMERIRPTDRFEDIGSAGYAIEAVPESYELKRTILEKLQGVLGNDAVVATNTSSISITRLAACYARAPDRVIGMHFMNPVPVMRLVEVIRGAQTSDATLAACHGLAKRLGKTCTTSLDQPGFIANRLLMPYINEAVFALQEGIGSREDIDETMRLGANMPMGPLQLADFIGLDTCLAIMQVLRDGLGEDKYRPCPLLVRHVSAGWLGRKTGKGFFDYADTQ